MEWTRSQLLEGLTSTTAVFAPASRYVFVPITAAATAAAAAAAPATEVRRGSGAWSPRQARRQVGKLTKNMIQQLNQVSANESMRDVARRLQALVRSPEERRQFVDLLLNRIRRPDEQAFFDRYGELVRRMGGKSLRAVGTAIARELTGITEQTLPMYMFAAQMRTDHIHETVTQHVLATAMDEVRFAWCIWSEYKRQPAKVRRLVVRPMRTLATRASSDALTTRARILAYELLQSCTVK